MANKSDTCTENCFLFLFLAPYARTTRYEEAFLPEGKKRPRSLRSLGLAMLNHTNKQINKSKQINKHPWYRKMFVFVFFWHPMLVRPAMKRLFCLNAKNGLGRSAPSALPQVSAFEFSRIFRRDRVGKNKTLEYFIYFFL